MGNGGRGIRYVPALDGVRALAVIAVLLFHAEPTLVPGGFLGVSVFFTLSGFLITTLLMTEHELTNRIDARRFIARRARRLLPAAHLCILLVLLAGTWWTASQRDGLPADAFAAMFDVANWRFLVAGKSYADLFRSAPSPLAHFWSLAIEEQWYIALPFLVRIAMRRRGVHDDLAGRRARVGAIALAVVVTGALLTFVFVGVVGGSTGRDLVYNSTITRGAELFVGALAAALMAGRRVPEQVAIWMSGIGLAGLLGCVMLADLGGSFVYNGGLLVVAVFSALTVVGFTSDHDLGRIVGAGSMAAIGRVSYGLYLYHWPVYLLLSEARVGVGGALLLVVRLAVTVAITLASYHFVEMPVREGRWPVAPAQVGAALAGSMAVIVVAVLAVPAPGYTTTEQLLADGDGGPVTFEPLDGSTSTTVPAPTPPTVLVVGSVGLAAATVGGDDRQVIDAVQSACPLVAGTGVRTVAGTEIDTPGCMSFDAVWASATAAGVPDVVVLALGTLDAGVIRRTDDTGYPDDDDVEGVAERLDVSRAGLRAALDTLVASGASLVLFDGTGTQLYNSGLAELVLERGLGLRVVTNLPDLAAASNSAVQTVIDARVNGPSTPAESDAVRLLVLGDSTSLDVARALNDGSDGRLEVMWAGRNGCPFVRVAAARPSVNDDWSATDCPPFDEVVPPLLESFRPDAILVVVGPTALEQQKYPGDWRGFIAGSNGYRTFHDAEMADFVDLVGDIPVLVADGPPIVAGGWASDEMADPDRLDAWNTQVARWDAAYDTVTVLEYAAALRAFEDANGNIRPDGVHPEVESLTVLARTTLVAMVVDLVRSPAA